MRCHLIITKVQQCFLKVTVMREVYKNVVLIIATLQYAFIASASTQKFWISYNTCSLKAEKIEMHIYAKE